MRAASTVQSAVPTITPIATIAGNGKGKGVTPLQSVTMGMEITHSSGGATNVPLNMLQDAPHAADESLATSLESIIAAQAARKLLLSVPLATRFVRLRTWRMLMVLSYAITALVV